MILVTGGTGYIGSHTVVELLQNGHEVVIADSLFNSHEWILDRIEKICGKRPHFVKADLANTTDVKQVFASYSISAVIHFAAFKAVGESMDEPLKYYKNNLFSLINLLDICLEKGIKDFVFSSSCTVYGEPDSLPISETAKVKPAESPYGNTKQIGEEIIRDTVKANAGKLNAISLRYFNPVGAHESALLGELPLGKPLNLIPLVTQAAAGKRPALQVFGSDYATIDGTCIRDFIHVVDVAKAHVVAISRLLNKKNKENYEVFNLGTGKGFSVLEVIKAFEKVSGVKVPYEMAPRRMGDVVQMWADTNYSNEELGWHTELDIEDMMRSAWAWEKSLPSTN